jgi:hypothetical protein
VSDLSTDSSEPDQPARPTQVRRFRPPARSRNRLRAGESSDVLRAGLEQVMPIALAEASDEAAERVLAYGGRIPASEHERETEDNDARNFASTLAAAFGTIAPSRTAAAVESWIGNNSDLRLALVPKWLRPALDPERRPRIMTMTSFANDRSRVIRQAIEESVPVLISRRGRIMAAVIPLEAGSYESEIYRDAGRERLAAMSGRPEVELDDATVEEILSSDDPAATAAAHGIDTSDWATLNPPRQG